MNKPLYKCATIWGIVGGTALAYLYFRTLGKDKGLNIDKVLVMGGSIGALLGIGVDLATKKSNKPATEQGLHDLAKSINPETETELNSYLSSVKDVTSESDKQKVLNVLRMFLSAKKDGKWDTKGDIETKKKVLESYGASKADISLFENTLKDHLTNSVSEILKEVNSKK